jgi:hypothetical protein
MSWDISFKHRDEFLLIISTEKDAVVSVVYTLYSSFVGFSALFLVGVLSFIPIFKTGESYSGLAVVRLFFMMMSPIGDTEVN